MTTAGKYLAGISNSIGMMVPAILANMVLPGSGMPLFYASIYGHNIQENALNPATKDSPSWVKVTNAAIRTGAEVVIEWGLNKALGGTLQNQLLGLSGKNFGKNFAKGLSKTVGLKFFFKSALQEGLEEFLQDFSTNLVDQFTGLIEEGYQHTGVNFQTLIDSFMIGALSSAFMSGGAVARNAVVSKITTNKETGISKYDNYIEGKDGAPERVKGLRNLAWSNMMQDFQKAIKDLSKNKFNIERNLDLAKQVYGGVTILTQFYKSFSTERIINAEKLLQRVSDAEQRGMAKFRSNNTVAGNILTDTTVKSIVKTGIVIEQASDLKTFTDTLSKEFTEMIGGVHIRGFNELMNAIDRASKKLKDGGVTGIKSVRGEDNTVFEKDGVDVKKQSKFKSKYEKLLKDYAWVFTTDGHVAVEVDDLIFVPEAWLENYEISDAYKFLAQEQILEIIVTEKELSSLVNKIVEHNKKIY